MAEGDFEEKVRLCAFSRVFYKRPLAGRILLERAGGVAPLFGMKAEAIDIATGVVGIGTSLFAVAKSPLMREEAVWYEEHNVLIISILDEGYPSLLKECCDAPPLLYYRGLETPAIIEKQCYGRTLSIVGTRLATPYGIESCRAVISSMADEGYNPLIISGLAKGIDITAHRSAIEGGLKTIAVLPCGIDIIYPRAHRSDAINIIAHGGIITEFPRAMAPLKRNFLQRNRIIAGMSRATLVAESRIAGGSMNSVSYANSYNREVFAIPGRMNDPISYGCNNLISKNIAALCLSGETIPKALGWSRFDTKLQPELFGESGGIKEKILLNLSTTAYRTTDAIVRRCNLGVEDISMALLELEIEGRVKKNSLGAYVRC